MSFSSSLSQVKSVKKWVLDIPFEWRMHVSQMGVKWDAAIKEMVWSGESVPDHLIAFKAPPLSLGWHRQYMLNQGHLERATRLEPEYRARHHQDRGSDLIRKAYLAKSPGFVLADEVGVGKTMTAWDFVLKSPEIKSILIVTTASAQVHWRNTVRHAGWLKGQSVLVINYDRLGKIFIEPKEGIGSQRKKGKRKRLAKKSIAPAFDLIIFDESHKGKNPESARGLMMRKLQQKASFSIWASATVGQHPLELIYIAPLLSHITQQKINSETVSDFYLWCEHQGLAVEKQSFGKLAWTYNEKDVKTIQEWLFQPTRGVIHGCRRIPEDIEGWVSLQRQVLPVDFSYEQKQRYAVIWDEFVRQEFECRKKSGNKKSLATEQNRMRLRQQSSWIKIENTIQYAQELLEQGKSVAISVAFRKTQDEMIKQFAEKGIEAEMIHGEMGSGGEKEQRRLRFQKDQVRVIVFTVEEAISLHRGEYPEGKNDRVLLIHDVRWSAIQLAQIEGRCHRDGKFALTNWVLADQTIDMEIGLAMIEKVKGMKGMHGDSVSELLQIEEILRKYAPS